MRRIGFLMGVNVANAAVFVFQLWELFGLVLSAKGESSRFQDMYFWAILLVFPFVLQSFTVYVDRRWIGGGGRKIIEYCGVFLVVLVLMAFLWRAGERAEMYLQFFLPIIFVHIAFRWGLDVIVKRIK